MAEQIGTNIHSFVGEFTIRNGSGVAGVIETGDTLYIGTGTHNAPRVDGNRVGLSVFDTDGTQRFPLDEGTAHFVFQGDRLEHKFSDRSGLTVTVVLSLYEAQRQDGLLYRAPYGLVVAGDPDQVGAWGADDNPD